MTRIVAISDTHNKHRELHVPDGDILIHAGDFSRKGLLEDLVDFNDWLGSLPHRHKVVIAGNHDFCFQKQPQEARKALQNAHYLEDSLIVLEGYRIYGSPWQPWFFDWAFNLKRGQEIAQKWDLIPLETDIVVTHGPPFGILDLTRTNKMVGCEELNERIKEIKPKVHIFGHIHEGYGQMEEDGILYVNASNCDASYRVMNDPVVIDL